MDVLKDILDNLSDSIVMIDPLGQVVLFNTEAVRIQKSISGKSIQTGAYFTDFVSEANKQTITETIRTVKRQKKPVKIFNEYSTDFGCHVFLERNFVPVLGPGKVLRYINIITEDITTRKVFEKKVRAAAEDLNKLFENAHALIFSVDSQGYVVEWNNHCEEIMGFSKNEIFSRKLPDVLIRNENIPVFNDLMAAVLKNQSIGNCEFSMQTKTGDELIVMISATPRTNANGLVIGATMVGQDITELTAYRRSLEKQVQNKTAALKQFLKKEKEAVEMKNRFVSIASHEFRSPLSSIDFATTFIKQNAGTINKKKLNEKVEVIEKHVNYMSHLLEDVLNYSKNETGKIKIIRSQICLENFIKRSVEEVTCNTKHSHHICVSTNSLGTLLTDEKLLRNILINLLTNAIKFSPGKEEVSLNILDRQAYISFEVRDEGIGIPEDEMELIFEPFIRGKAADPIHGTGLGLSIVKKAVDLLKGTIQLESEPGKGSVFNVTIPRHFA